MATATKTIERKYEELSDQALTAIEVISRELKNRKKAETWKTPSGLVDFTVHIYGSLVQGKPSSYDRKSVDHNTLIRALLAEMTADQKKAAIERIKSGKAKKLKADINSMLELVTTAQTIHKDGSIHGSLEVQMVQDQAETIEKMKFTDDRIQRLAAETER